MAGDNKFELQVYNPQAVNCEPNLIDSVHRIPSFSLLNQGGEKVTEKDLEGKVYVADFFFSRCPNICIEMTSQLLRVQEAFENEQDLMIVSHSVDPEHDQPAVLAEYAKEKGIDSNKWQLLTGDKPAIYELARCGYFITAKPSQTLENDFIHSDHLVLVDKEKRIRGYYSGTDREEVDRLITEIHVLLHEYNQ
ncbi:SCO family protein [Flammeovirgaceae bacterium SG7u.111]|nr:SCO family protein [Flammeovirgaceae bacterium SG7u.132]WPO33793.1 SCO family protein [Flammeovirgaceae bacterium SG7u.111]